MARVRLADTVGRWVGRVEVVLGGAEAILRDGEEALADGDASRARADAHEILARVPGSPIGLALLADACELGGLEEEYAAALEELAVRTPSRADVWVRLARARIARDGGGAARGETRDAFVRALAVAEAGSEERREALIALTDLDLAGGEPERAELWLERVFDSHGAAGQGPSGGRTGDLALRRAEIKLARGDARGAAADLAEVDIAPSDGRANLALGRALAISESPEAFTPLLARVSVASSRRAAKRAWRGGALRSPAQEGTATRPARRWWRLCSRGNGARYAPCSTPRWTTGTPPRSRSP
jgi:hypothetical protein